ncbi:hypothetical protein GKQ38_00015 [Candidatus Nanohaloarchaea archaeon]|nr:hypothetical protein GKQ38_00015 [Candidatus Nanohaloarchaea archaeon]
MTVETDPVDESVAREKRITQMKLDRVKQKIQQMEEKHGMNSEEFREKFQAGELGDEKEYMKWDMLLDAKKELGPDE